MPHTEPKKIAVVGATGLVGTAVVNLLQERGHSVRPSPEALEPI